MAKKLNLVGKKFGIWTVLGFNYRKDVGKYHYQMWSCLCKCGNKRIVEGTSLRKGNSISCGCIRADITPKESAHCNFKKGNVGYFTIHQWLRKNFGKATMCENPKCLGKSRNFEWALIKEKKYKRLRKNFMQLCVSCHSSYDNKAQNLVSSPTWLQSKK